MPRRITNLDAPYQSITAASRLTGLAQGFIRAGCKSGTISARNVRWGIPGLYAAIPQIFGN